MNKRKSRKWSVGDVFFVPTSDGMNVVGQIVGYETDLMNSVSCAFFDIRASKSEELGQLEQLPHGLMFSILFVTCDLLDAGVWPVIHRLPVTISRSELPYENLRNGGFVGAKVIGSGIVIDFLNSYYGLAPWDDWKDPNYLDKLLISPDKRPSKLVLKGNQ